MKILHIDSSARKDESVSRTLAADLVKNLKKDNSEVVYRDASNNIPFVAGIKGGGFIIPQEDRNEEDKKLFKFSDELVDEVLAADTIVISMPIYNFGPPAALKAWLDLVARAGRTFAYEPTGPKGLIEGNKKVYLVVTSGGVPIGSPVDFCTPWMKQVLNFLGITDIKIIDASQLNLNEDNLKKAEEQIKNI